MGKDPFFTRQEWENYVDKLKAKEKHKRHKKRDRESVTRRNKWGMISSGVGLLGEGAKYVWSPAGKIGKAASLGARVYGNGEVEDPEDREETKLKNASDRQNSFMSTPYLDKDLYDTYTKHGSAGLRNTVEGSKDRATPKDVMGSDLPKGEKGDSLFSRIYHFPANKFKQIKELYQSGRDVLHDKGIVKDDKNAFYDHAGEDYQDYVKNGGWMDFKSFMGRRAYDAQKSVDDSEDKGGKGFLRKATEFGGNVVKELGFDKITGALGFVPILGNWLQNTADSAFAKMEQNEEQGLPTTQGVMNEVKKNVNVSAIKNVGKNVFKTVIRNKVFGDRAFSENNPYTSLSSKSGGDYSYNVQDGIADLTKFVRDAIEGYTKGSEISDFTKNPKDKLYSTLGAAFDSASGSLKQYAGRKEDSAYRRAAEEGKIKFLAENAPRSKSAHEYLKEVQNKIQSGEVWEQKNQREVDNYNRSLRLAELRNAEKDRKEKERLKAKERQLKLKQKGKEKKIEVPNIWGNDKETQARLNGEAVALNIPTGVERDAYFQDPELYLANHPKYKEKGGLNLNIGGMQIMGGKGGWQNTNRYIRDKFGVLVDTWSPAFKKKKGSR